MFLRTAPIFKINLLLADISFLDSCRIFSYFKVWARESELEQASSCDELQGGHIRCPRKRFIRSGHVPMHLELLNDTRNVFRLILENVADPIQKFLGNLHDGLRLAHPFTVLLEGRRKRRLLADCNPGSFNEQPSQLRMAPLRHSSNVLFFTTSLSVWTQSN